MTAPESRLPGSRPAIGSINPAQGAQPAPGAAARFQIVSPPFACGVTWLVNALLHLGVKVTNIVGAIST